MATWHVEMGHLHFTNSAIWTSRTLSYKTLSYKYHQLCHQSSWVSDDIQKNWWCLDDSFLYVIHTHTHFTCHTHRVEPRLKGGRVHDMETVGFVALTWQSSWNLDYPSRLPISTCHTQPRLIDSRVRNIQMTELVELRWQSSWNLDDSSLHVTHQGQGVPDSYLVGFIIFREKVRETDMAEFVNSRWLISRSTDCWLYDT